MQKQAILVVGTGRCGTSAMAGALRILGAHLGEDLTRGDLHNPKGYFENTSLVELNKGLLSAAGIIWYATPVSEVRALPPTLDTCQAIQDSVQSIFREETPIAIKDPRLCALLHPYVSALTAIKYEIYCVVMSRDPHEVAQSMETATNVSAEVYLPMVRHYAELLDSALQQNRIQHVCCAFSELLTDTKSSIERVVRRLPFLSCSDDQLKHVLRFIDRSLRHHNVSKP